MNHLIRLLRLSAKEYFREIRKRTFFSFCLQKQIVVSRSFYNHITKKPRDLKEMAQRLAMFPLIPIIIEKGVLCTEDEQYIKISYQIVKIHHLSCILYKENDGKISLISCFEDFRNNKK